MLDKERRFNKIYKESSKEADALANEGIEELYFGCGELVLDAPERLLNKIRFQGVTDQLKVYALAMLTLIFCALTAGAFRPAIGIWSEIIYAAAVAVNGIFILAYGGTSVLLHDRAWLTVGLTERRELAATLIVEKWVAGRHDVDELLPAFKASVDMLKKYQAFIKGGIIVAGAFLTFFKLIFGERISLHDSVLAPLSIPASYGPYVYVALFAAVFVVTFVFVSAPLGWRESIEPHLVRAIERYKRRSG